MPPESPRRRIGARVVSGAAIGLMAAAALAAPAAAQDAVHPFIHSPVEITGVAPGSTVEVSPTFLQQDGLGATAGIVATFTDSFARIGMRLEGAESIADFDNCVEAPDTSIQGGVSCVITDFTDQPGTALTFTEPIRYAIAADAVGPLDICGCAYYVEALDATRLAAEFGDLTWDPASTNLLGLEPVATWEGPADSEAVRYDAAITVTTSANPLDLEIGSARIEGLVGREYAVTVPVSNSGPATAYNRSDDFGSYSVRATLPEGTELAGIDSDGNGDWSCLDEESLELEYSRTETQLTHYDLYCFLLTPLTAGATLDFTYTVKVTAETERHGRVEIATLYKGDGGQTLDPQLDDNIGYVENAAKEGPPNDFNGDGITDLVTVRGSDGSLVLHPGTGSGTLGTAKTIGTGWRRFDVVMAGDLTSDGNADLLARDTRTGKLFTYPGNGNGGLGARLQVGSGWGSMGTFTVLDFDGDGVRDLLAVRGSDGQLNVYPGRGDGTFGSAAKASVGFNWADSLISPGDIEQDGIDDFVARIGQTQGYWVFLSSREDAIMLDPWLGSSGETTRFSQVAGLGDLDRDGLLEIAAVNSRSGDLTTHLLTTSGHIGPGTSRLATGWGGMRLPSVTEDRTYDYDQDGANDLIARSTPLAYSFLYTGNGTGGFGPRIEWGLDHAAMNLLETAGDFNGDGYADLLARKSTTGTLFLDVGDGVGGYDFEERITVGTGWNVMSAIVSGHDFNGDGKVDIVAREKSTGYLWLYPGTGNGKVAARVKLGSGWNAMREITAPGDLDHDGRADLIAVRGSDNCLYFYAGLGNGTFKSAVNLGCGWGGLNSLAAVGDFSNDGHNDFVARRASDGKLFLYKGNGTGGFTSAIAIGSGWNAMDLIA